MDFNKNKNLEEISEKNNIPKKKEKEDKKEENIQILNKKRKRYKINKDVKTINKIKKNQIDIKNLNITNDTSYNSQIYGGNSFCIFNSIDNILYPVYSSYDSIISYNLLNYRKMNEIKGAMNNHYISDFKHIFDINNKRDLLLSTSCECSNLKVWNIKNWECLCVIKQIIPFYFLFSACFLSENNQIYVLTANNYRGKVHEISAFTIPFKGYNSGVIKIIS